MPGPYQQGPNQQGSNQQGKPWEERLHEAGARFEEELQRVMKYVDAEVVPEVRRHGSAALKKAAIQLQKFAEHMDDAPKPPPTGPTNTTGER